jgi:hypothetical protein
MSKLTLQDIEKTAVQVLEQTGKHSPQIIVETPQGVVMVVLCFRNQDEKHKMHESIRALVKRSEVDSYFYVAEAWMAKQTKDNPVMSPSRCVDRHEVLMIAEFRRDGSGESIMREFKRKDDSIVWKAREVQRNNEASSFLDFFSDPNKVRRRVDEDTFRHNKEYAENFASQLFKKYGAEFEKYVQVKDEVALRELLAKIQREMDAEITRLNLMRLEDVEAENDEDKS